MRSDNRAMALAMVVIAAMAPFAIAGLWDESYAFGAENSAEVQKELHPEDAPDDGLRSWTVGMYWAADNNLDELTETFVKMWMENLTNTVDVALSVFIDRLELPANLSTLTEAGWVEVEELGEVNSSDPATLEWFIEYTLTEPSLAAERYLLMIQDHGLGYLGLCSDDGEGGTWMSIDGLGRAFENANAATGKKVDVIALDACTLALVEVAYELRDKASYLVASEKAVPFDGMNYGALLTTLSENPGIAPLDLACKMVDDYADWYSAPLGTYPTLYPYMQDFASLSVIDLSRVGGLAEPFRKLTELVCPAQSSLIGPLREAAKTSFVAMWMNCMGCDYGSDIIVMFTSLGATLAESYPDIAVACEEIVAAADEAIVKDWASWRFRDRVTGLAVSVTPGIGIYEVNWDTLNRVYDQLELDFVEDTSWDQVLEEYFAPCRTPA